MKAYDLIVIGAGAAGSSVAETANEAGHRVALVEREHLGGTCLNYGCDPTKTLLYTADLRHRVRQADNRGLTNTDVGFDWQAVQAHVQQVQNDMRGGTREAARAAMRARGIDLFWGEGRFVDAHQVAVNDQTLRGERILIATGAAAVVPDIPGLEEAGYLTNKTALSLQSLPQSLVIVGGGPIGVEFAQIFHRFGVQVTLVEAEAMILPKDDPELAEALLALLRDEGIALKLQTELTAVEQTDAGKQLTLTHANDDKETLVADDILLAVGRRPVTDSLNLEAAGVELTDDGWIDVNDKLQTSVPHIWAAGDILGTYQFTHYANFQGRYLAEAIFADDPQPFERSPVPWVTYTTPALAHVGKTEAELEEAGRPYTVARAQMADNARAKATGQTDGLVKLLFDEDDTLVGGHILSAHAGELIGTVIVALKAGVTQQALQQTILPYPTLVNAITAAQHNGR